MDARQRLVLLNAELKRRFKLARKKYDFTDYNFPLQKEILQDLARFQAWQCTRRFGKSTSFGKKALNIAVNNPGAKILYLALTRDSAIGILWGILENELKQQGMVEGIDYKTDKTNAVFTFRGSDESDPFKGGGTIKFFGVNSNANEMKKILGQAYDLVGIDECGSMTVDMQVLILQMILAALSDRRGSLVLLGTAENIPNTFFEEVTSEKEKSLDWKIYKCSTVDNPYMAKQFKEDMEMILRNNPLAAETSWFRTHWLNEWCADDDLIIIKNNPDLNHIEKLPESDNWIYGLGVDLGFNDATSFVIGAVSSDYEHYYTVEAFKASGMDFTDTANIIKKYNSIYGFTFAVVDGANKQGVAEMQRRHDLGLTLESADKTDKATFLRLMADDYKQGRVKHVSTATTQLDEEQGQLMWIKGTDKEDPRCQNHLNDGQLYIWRKMRPYFEPKENKCKTPDEEMENQFKKELEEAIRAEEEMALLF